MSSWRIPGHEGRFYHRNAQNGTMARTHMPAPGIVGIVRRTSSNQTSSTPVFQNTSSPITVVFITTGDTRPHPYSEFPTYDDYHETQAYTQYNTQYVYSAHDAAEAQRRLQTLAEQGLQADRIVFLGHGNNNGFIFHAEVDEQGNIRPYHNQASSIFTGNETGLLQAIGNIRTPNARVEFDACYVGRNRQLIQNVESVVGTGNVQSTTGRYSVGVTRTEDPETGDATFTWEETSNP